MRVRMTTGLSGPRYTLSPGDEHDFEPDEALRLIEAGIAVPAESVKVERAVRRRPAEKR